MSIEYVIRTSTDGHFEELPLNVGGVASGLRNLLVNPGFDIWLNGLAATVGLNTLSETASRWYAEYTGDAVVDNTVSRVAFDPGQSAVPGEPSYYWHWEIGESSPDPITAKFLQQSLPDVRNLQGSVATISFWIRTNAITGRSVTASLTQFFGTGGSPSSPVVVSSSSAISPTGSWQKMTAPLTLETVAGKVLGSNSDDELTLRLSFPFAPSGGPTMFVDIADVQLETGGEANDFAKRIYSEDLAICKAFQPVVPIDGGASSTTDIDGVNADSVTIPANTAVSFISSGITNSFVRADSSASGALPVHGFTTDSSAVAGSANVRMLGPLEGFSGLTAGAYYYSSPSLRGGVTATVPSALNEKAQRIGFALTATRLNVTPGLSVKRSSAAIAGGGVDLKVINNTGSTLSGSTAVATGSSFPNGQVTLASAASGSVAPAFAFLPYSIANGATGVARVSGPMSGFSGLTPGVIYYLDPTSPGGITATAPTGTGQFVQRMGEAVDSSTLNIEIYPGYIKAAAAATGYANVLQPYPGGHFQEIAVALTPGTGGGGGGGGGGTLNPEFPLSHGKTVTFDSTYEGAGQPGEMAVDGLLTTKWASDPFGGPHWIQIDLGSAKAVGHYRAIWAWGESDVYNAPDFSLQYKDDTDTFIDLDPITGNTLKVVSRDVTTTTARIWRLYITTSSQPGGDGIARLSEIALYSPGHGTAGDTIAPAEAIAIGVTAYLSSTFSVNGDLDTVVPLAANADPAGFLTPTANTFTVPTGLAGTYLLSSLLVFGTDSAADDAGMTLIYVNGSLVESTVMTCNNTCGQRTRLQTNAVLDLVAGDTVQLTAANRTTADGVTQYVHDGIVSMVRVVGDTSSVTTAPAALVARLTTSALTTLPASTPVTFDFDTELSDSSNIASGGVLTIPTTGIYYLLLTAETSADTSGNRIYIITKNGSDIVEQSLVQPVVLADVETRGQLVAIAQLTAGDTLTVQAETTSGADVTIAAGKVTFTVLKVPRNALSGARAFRWTISGGYDTTGDTHNQPYFDTEAFWTMTESSPGTSSGISVPLTGFYLIQASATWQGSYPRLVSISDGHSDDVALVVESSQSVTTQMSMIALLNAGDYVQIDSDYGSGAIISGTFDFSMAYFTGGTGFTVTPTDDPDSGLTGGGGGSGTVTTVTGVSPIVVGGDPAVTPEISFLPAASISMHGHQFLEMNLENVAASAWPTGLTSGDAGRIFWDEDGQRVMIWTGTAWQLLAPDIAQAPYPPTTNYFDNPQLYHWQRGALGLTIDVGGFPAASRTFLADRWATEAPVLPGGVSLIVERFNTDPTGWISRPSMPLYVVRFTKNGGALGNTMGYVTRLPDAGFFGGQTVTMSATARSSASGAKANFRVRIWTGAVTASWVDVDTSSQVTMGTSWSDYSATFLMPDVSSLDLGGAQDHYMEFALILDFNTSSDRYIEATNFQLERGGTLTPFAPVDYITDLARCRRFFETDSTTIISARTDAAVQFSPKIRYRSDKWKTPTVYISGHETVGDTYGNDTVNREAAAFGSDTAVSDTDQTGFNITFKGPTGTVPGDRIGFIWTADCEPV